MNELIDGCLNVMGYLKIMPGLARVVQQLVWIERLATVASEQTGIFYPSFKRGTYVEQGMKIGYVTNYFGKYDSKHTHRLRALSYMCARYR